MYQVKPIVFKNQFKMCIYFMFLLLPISTLFARVLVLVVNSSTILKLYRRNPK